MTSVTYEYEKYICTSSTLLDTINKYGVAIIPSVLNEEECNEMIEGMWNTLGMIATPYLLIVSNKVLLLQTYLSNS